MRKMMLGCVLLVLASAQAASALDIGVFGSRWSHKEGEAVWGGGVLLLAESLPLELRATYYESATPAKIEAHPLDFGLAIGLTRLDTVNVTAIGGGTYYWINAKHSSPDNEFGWYAGGRVEVTAPRDYTVFGELIYRGANLDVADFRGLTINIGLLF